MFNLFKKPKPKPTPQNLAEETLSLVRASANRVQNETTAFLVEYDEYSGQENKIRHEIQWMPYVAAVIAISMHSSTKDASVVIEKIAEILQHGLHQDDSTKDVYKKFKARVDGYFTRFNRGMTFRNPKGGKEIMGAISESLFDCANEGIFYFTSEERSFLDDAKIMNLKLEERKPWSMLEMHVREVLMSLFFSYVKHFEKFNWKY